MSGYPLFIPGFVLSTNPSLFKFKIANEHREFRNYLFNHLQLHIKENTKKQESKLLLIITLFVTLCKKKDGFPRLRCAKIH